MSDRRSYIALDWVNAEIIETLSQAMDALEGFICNFEDITRLRFSLTYVHQVSGSLTMIELHGASLLAREIESYISKIIDNENSPEVQEAAAKLIKKSLGELSEYVQRVSKTHEDNPIELLGVLNRIREANHEEKFSESDVFNPDVTIAHELENKQPEIAVDEFNELIRKLRQTFQTGFIGVIRDKDIEANFSLMHKVCESLYKVSTNTVSQSYWQIAFAITDHLVHKNTNADLESKKALKQIDAQIKYLEEVGRDALLESPDSALLKSLLYSVATTDVVTEPVAELRTIYKLDQALAESEIKEVLVHSKLLKSLISNIKLDVDNINKDDVSSLLVTLKRLMNSFSVLGLSKHVESLTDLIELIKQSNERGESLLGISEKIDWVLKSTSAFADDLNDEKVQQITINYQAYVSECRESLEKIKELILEYVGALCDNSIIQSMPYFIDEQIEKLNISLLVPVLPILNAAKLYIVEQLLSNVSEPEWSILESLADAISSVEYYVECASGESSENLAGIIVAAEESIERLGYQIGTTGFELSPTEEAEISGVNQENFISEIKGNDSAIDISESFSDENLDSPALDENSFFVDSHQDNIAEFSAEFESEVQNNLHEVFDSANEEVELVLDSENDQEENIEPVAEIKKPLEPEVADELVYLLVMSEDIDEEILEIFIEEGREVVENINNFLPELKADYNNSEALIEIRRAFHTLKGSGRMVGAMFLGEYAWSVERMLNSVRDGLAKINDNSMSILYASTERVPALLDALEKNEPVSKKFMQEIMDRANAEWEGKPLVEIAKVAPVEAPVIAEKIEALDAEKESLVEESLVEESLIEGSDLISEPSMESDVIDEELLEIFTSEAESHIDTLIHFLDNINPGYEDVQVTPELQRAMHTLKGSSYMAGVMEMAKLAGTLETFVKDLSNFQTKIDADILTMLVRASEFLSDQLARLKQGSLAQVEGVEGFVAELHAMHANKIEKQGGDSSKSSIGKDKYKALISEALECMTASDELLAEWQSVGIDLDKQEELVNYLYRLSDTATEVNYPEIADLSLALADYYCKTTQSVDVFSKEFFELSNRGQNALDDMMDIVAAQQTVQPAIELIAELRSGLKESVVEEVQSVKKEHKHISVSDEMLGLNELRQQVLAADKDTLEIFTEELGELYDVLDALIRDWLDDHADLSSVAEIRRILHTIKGGARITELSVLGNLTHDYESKIDAAESKGKFDKGFFEQIEAFQNKITFYIDDIITGGAFKQAPVFENALLVTEPEIIVDVESVVPETEVVENVVEERVDLESSESLVEFVDFANMESADIKEDFVLDASPEQEMASNLESVESAFVEWQDESARSEFENIVEADASLPIEEDFILDLEADPIYETEINSGAVEEIFVETESVPPSAIEIKEVVSHEDKRKQKKLERKNKKLKNQNGGALTESDEVSAANESEESVLSPNQLEVEAQIQNSESINILDEVISEAGIIPPQFITLAAEYKVADVDTLGIFLEEALELDADLEAAVKQWLSERENIKLASAVQHILNTIKGGARLLQLSVLGDVVQEFEKVIEVAEAQNVYDSVFFDCIEREQKYVHTLLDFIAKGAVLDSFTEFAAVGIFNAKNIVPEQIQTTPKVSTDESVTAVSVAVDTSFDILAEQFKKADADTLEIFLEEARELDAALDEVANQWLAAHENVQCADELKRILHTLKGGARLTEISVLGDLTHNYESMIESAEVKKLFDADFFQRIQSYQDQVHAMIEFMVQGTQGTDVQSDLMNNAPIIASYVPLEATPQPIFEEIKAPVFVQPMLIDAEIQTNREDEVEIKVLDGVDNELIQLFAEEAKEQNDGIEECIVSFIKDNKNPEPLEELKRLLHTLKGGARLTGMKEIGDLSHDFESLIINGERDKKVQTPEFLDGMQEFHDKLNKNILAINAVVETKVEVKKAESNVVPIRQGVNPMATAVSQAAIDATRNFIDNFNKNLKNVNREPVKITPDLLESLINLAGEGSIGRSRIEEQMNELAFSQDEMSVTVERLHSQLRRLEIETEAQIVFRQEQVVSEGQENFDPLEMDRYTQMQQISKSLIESASDLDDISATFTNKMRDMETLLVQQGRINTELQESLMRCQMVPFSRMVPRLRRVVRQVAQELGKKVEFNVENAEGEMDRTILERMVTPLEHMLRNAVDHGIEMPEVRRAAGKKEQGDIVLTLSREGGEIVLTLKDNGGGVNIAAVRKKAIERGLIDADTQLSEHELAQFILHAGFSTAQVVTQISGRGVGMDIVYSEIKQMGGSLEISSVSGQGSVFSVRLPFTVSVNRALMVYVGTETYAVPLNTIEGIVRVSPYELEAYYQPDAPLFEYAGQSYNLRYMGGLLNRGQMAKLEGLTTPLPVVLIRSSDYTVAVQVDKLLGSREVVVKSLGPQFSMVSGISGATVLGNGSVVIILDMLALIRADFAHTKQHGSVIESEVATQVVRKATRVMVCDDSVTVRKVTSRLLERFGLEVILAKDGLDAITQLQEMEDLPNIILLDIEMPRMDGFEVLSRVRHDTRLQHIPISMITSRTGDKHRDRAISLGANRYLGKPFQERELLQTISELTGAEVQQA